MTSAFSCRHSAWVCLWACLAAAWGIAVVPSGGAWAVEKVPGDEGSTPGNEGELTDTPPSPQAPAEDPRLARFPDHRAGAVGQPRAVDVVPNHDWGFDGGAFASWQKARGHRFFGFGGGARGVWRFVPAWALTLEAVGYQARGTYEEPIPNAKANEPQSVRRNAGLARGVALLGIEYRLDVRPFFPYIGLGLGLDMNQGGGPSGSRLRFDFAGQIAVGLAYEPLPGLLVALEARDAFSLDDVLQKPWLFFSAFTRDAARLDLGIRLGWMW